MTSLKKNINNLIKSYKKKGILESDRSDLMALILLMVVNYCGIDQSKYHIMSSYAIRDFKSIRDLDVIMNDKEWPKILKSKIGVSKPYNNTTRYLINLPSISADAEIEIFCHSPTHGFPTPKFSHKSLKNKLVKDKYGNLYYSLDTFVEWKDSYHRDKDYDQLNLLLKGIKQKRKTISGRKIMKNLHYTSEGQINKLILKISKVVKSW